NRLGLHHTSSACQRAGSGTSKGSSGDDAVRRVVNAWDAWCRVNDPGGQRGRITGKGDYRVVCLNSAFINKGAADLRTILNQNGVSVVAAADRRLIDDVSGNHSRVGDDHPILGRGNDKDRRRLNSRYELSACSSTCGDREQRSTG